MTQSKNAPHVQSGTAEQLLAACEAAKQEVFALRERWFELVARYQGCCKRTGEVYARSVAAWDAYQAARERQGVLLNAVLDASRVAGSVKPPG